MLQSVIAERIEEEVRSSIDALKSEENKLMQCQNIKRFDPCDSPIDAYKWKRFHEHLRKAKPHQATVSSIHGNYKQLKELTLGDLIGKRKRTHTNNLHASVVPTKSTRKDNGSQTFECAPLIPSEDEKSMIGAGLTVEDVARLLHSNTQTKPAREPYINPSHIENYPSTRRVQWRTRNGDITINELPHNTKRDLFYWKTELLEPSLLEFIDPSSFSKGSTEQIMMMTDKEIEEELLTDPEASLAEIYKKRDVRMQIYAALGEAPPKGRPPRNEMEILKERVRMKFGAKSREIADKARV